MCAPGARTLSRDLSLDGAEDQIGFVMTIATASSLVVQAPAGVAESVFGPAVAAITLGLMGSRAFARRIGRNESFNHAGNAVAAALAGICAWKEGPIAVFCILAGMALLSIVGVLTIRADAIDYDRARGLHDGPSTSHEKQFDLGVLMSNRGPPRHARSRNKQNSHEPRFTRDGRNDCCLRFDLCGSGSRPHTRVVDRPRRHSARRRKSDDRSGDPEPS
jgi:hypothetical protein